MISESENLAEFAKAVRDSTIKRLKQVPAGKENWRITPEAMSIAEIAYHLIETDEWLMEKIEIKELDPKQGKTGTIKIDDNIEFRELIERLQQSGEKRCSFVRKLDGSKLQSTIFDKRFGKEVTIWWIIFAATWTTKYTTGGSYQHILNH